MALTASSWAQCVTWTRSRSHALSHQEEDDGDGDTSQLRLVDCWRVPSSQRGWVWAPARRITVPPPELCNVRSEFDNARVWESLESELSMVYVSCERFACLCMFPPCVRHSEYRNDTKVWSVAGLGGKTLALKCCPCPTCSRPTGRTGLVSGKLEVCMVWLCGYVNTLGEIMTDWECKKVSKVGYLSELCQMGYLHGWQCWDLMAVRSTVLTHCVFHNRF